MSYIYICIYVVTLVNVEVGEYRREINNFFCYNVGTRFSCHVTSWTMVGLNDIHDQYFSTSVPPHLYSIGTISIHCWCNFFFFTLSSNYKTIIFL